ncbi:radical SAM/SPASM domain-containing protein [Candidatus Aciduliprofundum boonei]|uniref:Radical SAM domain protein n=1 Tax=Aciduliprofundum boonei (strain DSM 19572 / T469) TaxID=439481 RepID=D3TBX1_ACIB4|nr:radical SAM protein [Candidatus Aciduliprofundum boonei]ADD08056.1 Radical SAM domain protein [Aciduliprofundum boonei T469]
MSYTVKDPPEGIVAVTYRCNARCYMCNIWKHPSDPKDEIKADDLVSLPGDKKKMRSLNITGGEPFIRTDLGDIISVLRPKTKRLVISTNGYFTDRIVKIAEEFPDIGIRVSLEGLPAVSDKLRGLLNGFDHGLRTLLKLHEMGFKDIGFGITVSDLNHKDMLELYTLAAATGWEFATAVLHNSFYFHKFDNKIEYQNEVAKSFEILINKLLKTHRVKNWYRAFFNYGIINRIYGNPRLLPCGAGTDLFYVDPYGNVRPCNAMDFVIGNIKEETFDKIWRSEKAKEMRERVRSCTMNCWMIGSASPAIRKDLWRVTKWVVKAKFNSLLGKEIKYEDMEKWWKK